MKIAYIISAYKLPDQLVRLVKRLNSDDVSFVIHVDRKTSAEAYGRMVGPLSAYRNVSFLERHTCNWGDFGHVRATLKGIHEVFARGIGCDYTVLLTGQDYPIKSNRYIQTFLRKSEGRSFMHYFAKPDPLAEAWEERIAYWHLSLSRWHVAFPQADMFETPMLNRLWKMLANGIPLRRRLPRGLEPVYGSSYWCLSRDCVEYIHRFVQRDKAFVRFFRHVPIPDEIFFQTILVNSPLKDCLVNRDLVYKRFEHKPNPAVLGKLDFGRFMGTDNLFARKFDVTANREVLDMIDESVGAGIA